MARFLSVKVMGITGYYWYIVHGNVTDYYHLLTPNLFKTWKFQEKFGELRNIYFCLLNRYDDGVKTISKLSYFVSNLYPLGA